MRGLDGLFGLRGSLADFFSFRCLGDCKPQQIVPQELCFKQFYNICRNGRKHGTSMTRYDGGGCQHWAVLKKGWEKLG
jgi:hypothetical protein